VELAWQLACYNQESHPYAALTGCSRLLGAKSIHHIVFEAMDWAAKRTGRTTSDYVSLLNATGYEVLGRQGSTQFTPLTPERAPLHQNLYARPR
jgi:hypothetical protein